MEMVSKDIDKIKSIKGDNWKGRLVATTQFLDVMMNEGCEGYERYKQEGNYLWAHKHPQSEGGTKVTGRGGKGRGTAGGAGSVE